MPIETAEFLRSFLFDGGFLQLAVGTVDNSQYFEKAPKFKSVPENTDVYFSPALRRTKGGTKADVLGTVYLWIDVDDPVLPDTTFPPTAVVFSGNGNHLYWRLSEPVTDALRIEQLNKMLIGDVPTADAACWNSNRLMRVPGTWNVHRPNKPPRLCELRTFEAWSYTAEDIEVLGRLDERARYAIRSGSADEWQSRSERDWYVVNQLVVANASDELITFLFDKQPVGDKYRDGDNGAAYLRYTINKVREEYADKPIEPGEQAESKAKKERRRGNASVPTQIVEKKDGYWIVGATSRRVSTFVLDPLVLLQSIEQGAQDAIVCDVKADDETWQGVTFARDAFNSVAALDRYCPSASWIWLGSDADVRLLLPFLMERLREKTAPKVTASSTVGLHFVGGQWLFLGDNETLGAQDYWRGIEGPLTWLPVEREHPIVTWGGDVLTRQELATVVEFLPMLNEPCPLWTMIGWHAAAALKPWLLLQGYKFPVLNITGTRGAGKTSLNRNVMMKLFSGQQAANVYDAGTTKFVRLALLSSSNAIPVAFGEFRYESVEEFMRTVLQAYDGGSDARGRQNQTTQQWRYEAPLSIDGEDVIGDAAARERLVLARMRPETIAENTEAWAAYKDFNDKVPKAFARHYLQSCINAVEGSDAHTLLNEAKSELFAEYPTTLPDRVRSNYIIALFGVKMYQLATGAKVPGAEVFNEGLAELVNIKSGRSRALVDEFVEALVNQALQYGHRAFAWAYDAEKKHFWFQMSSAHSWWLGQRRRQGVATLQREAITHQLREARFFLGTEARSQMAMYGIDLPRAAQFGLDIPEELGRNAVTIEW